MHAPMNILSRDDRQGLPTYPLAVCASMSKALL